MALKLNYMMKKIHYLSCNHFFQFLSLLNLKEILKKNLYLKKLVSIYFNSLLIIFLFNKLGTAMGFPISELKHNLTEEAELFRLELFKLCQKTELERGTFGVSHYAFFHEPLIKKLSSKKLSSCGNFY